MKKLAVAFTGTLMTAFAASLIPASPAQAQAQANNVQVYARLNTGVESLQRSGGADGASERLTRMSNYRSVLGFRGTEEMGGGLRAIFQIEGQVALDRGAGQLASRNTRVGLEGPAGTIFAGNWNLPYTSATANFDPYPTTASYMSIMGNGTGPSVDNTSNTSAFDRRQQNSLHYWSPVWQGIRLIVARSASEERPANGAKPFLTSGALIYDEGDWYATAAFERHHDYLGPGRSDSAAKLGLAYRFGDTRLALIAEHIAYDTPGGTLKRNAGYLSLTHQMGAHGLRLSLGVAGDGSGSAADGARVGFMRKGEATGATHITTGYDYTVSPRTNLFAYYTHLHNERNGVVDFSINTLGNVSPGTTLQGPSLGIRHTF